MFFSAQFNFRQSDGIFALSCTTLRCSLKRCKCVTCDMHFSRLPGKQERYCGIIPGNQILARNRDNLEGSCSSVALSCVVLEVSGYSGSFMVSIREIWWKKYSVDFHVGFRILLYFVSVCCMPSLHEIVWPHSHRGRKISADNLQSCEPNSSNEIGTTAATGCLSRATSRLNHVKP